MPAKPTTALGALFFFSGMFALVYEALWHRRFALVFGSAAPATAAVLAAYFAGLALGSWAFGRKSTQFKNPLRTYALLEVGIALGAILVEVWLQLFERLPVAGVGAKTFLAFVALAVPTICMGGTLPALGALLENGRSATLLYVLNTAGAALGILALPFLLLPALGGKLTLAACALGNLSLAAIAWNLKHQPTQAQPTSSSNKALLGLAFASGFAAFVLQIVWNRAFAQVHENSLYSFAVIVAVFILALAAGGQAARVLLARKFTPATVIGAAWLFAAVAIYCGPALFIAKTNSLSYLVSTSGWFNYGTKLLGLSMLLVFPGAFFLGLVLPTLMEKSSQALGSLLATNLIGGVVGALCGGFLFPAMLGLWGTFGALAIAVGALGAIQLARARTFFPLIALAAILFVPPPFRLPVVRLAQQAKLIAHSEGSHGVVAVTEAGPSRRLKLNNSYVLGGTSATGDERFQGHLPLLLHPRPRSVAFMGLGTGITASAAHFHTNAQITIAELVPEVVTAARTHFTRANLAILDDTNRVRVIVEDARNYLRRASDRHDVIIGDLVVPWRAGEGALFTLENFHAARRALANDGLFCQWLPLFQLSKEEFESIARTFLEVFPRAQLWRGDFSPTEPSLALVGCVSDKTPPRDLQGRLDTMLRDPANPHVREQFAVWMHFVGVIEASDFSSAPLNTEDRPWIELTGPRRHAGSNREQLFVGRALQSWIAAFQKNAAARAPEQAKALQAGAALFDFTLNLSENNRIAAARAQAELRTLAPPTVYATFFP